MKLNYLVMLTFMNVEYRYRNMFGTTSDGAGGNGINGRLTILVDGDGLISSR